MDIRHNQLQLSEACIQSFVVLDISAQICVAFGMRFRPEVAFCRLPSASARRGSSESTVMAIKFTMLSVHALADGFRLSRASPCKGRTVGLFTS